MKNGILGFWLLLHFRVQVRVEILILYVFRVMFHVFMLHMK